MMSGFSRYSIEGTSVDEQQLLRNLRDNKFEEVVITGFFKNVEDLLELFYKIYSYTQGSGQ